MAEQKRRLVRLAVLEELRASYGIKVKSGSCLTAAAKQPGAAAAEVRRAVTLRRSRRAPDGRARPRRGCRAAAAEAARLTQARELVLCPW